MSNSFESEIEEPEMDALSSLAENLVYLLPGCADVMVRKTLQEVYRDFCRRSCCLCGRRHFVLSSEGTVSVAPMFGGLLDCISEVRYNGRVLGYMDYTTMGTRINFRDALVPEPDCDDSQLPEIDVTFVEMPKMNSECVPCWFVQRHGESVCAGVLARLMAMTGKAWSDPQQAAENRVRYENAVCEARMRYYDRTGNGDLGWAVNPDGLV